MLLCLVISNRCYRNVWYMINACQRARMLPIYDHGYEMTLEEATIKLFCISRFHEWEASPGGNMATHTIIYPLEGCIWPLR